MMDFNSRGGYCYLKRKKKKGSTSIYSGLPGQFISELVEYTHYLFIWVPSLGTDTKVVTLCTWLLPSHHSHPFFHPHLVCVVEEVDSKCYVNTTGCCISFLWHCMSAAWSKLNNRHESPRKVKDTEKLSCRQKAQLLSPLKQEEWAPL